MDKGSLTKWSMRQAQTVQPVKENIKYSMIFSNIFSWYNIDQTVQQF